MDAIDQRILALLQEDAGLSVQEIGAKVHLSSTPCWKRIRRLERDGYVMKKVALLNPARIGAAVTVFVAIKTDRHDPEWLEQFAAAVHDMPEVMEFYRMSGEVDYLLRVAVRDIAAYDAFYKRLIKRIPLSNVTSTFAMEQIKYTTALPLPDTDVTKRPA